MANYFRITGYYPNEDCSFIADSYGKFEKLWQFSSYFLKKGIKILEVNYFEDSKDLNIGIVPNNTSEFYLRAVKKGKPTYTEREINGILHKIVDVNGKYYVPNYKRDTIDNG